MKIAISTPTGQVGSAITEKLMALKEHDLLLFTRKPEKLRKLEEAGGKVISCDLTNVNEVKRGLQGVDAFHLLAPEWPGRSSVQFFTKIVGIAIEAIKANKVPRVVFNSSYGAQNDADTGPIRGLRNGEIMLSEIESDLAIIRPCYYMENFLWYLDQIKKEKGIAFPFPGETRYRFISTRDVGYATVDVITDMSWSGKIIREIHGAEDLSFNEALAIISDVVGFEVKFIEKTPEELITELTSPEVGYSEEFAQELTEAYTAIGNGLLGPEFPVRDGIIGGTSFAEFVKEVIVPAMGN